MKLSIVRVACLGVLCIASATPAFDFDASGATGDTMPMVLTPARLNQPQSQVPASVTIIDRELIAASGAREIYQLLQLVPGMAAVKVDGNVPTVSYHATQARDVRRMLVLIDGRSQYLPGLARVLWNDFPIAIEDIERIEVTRGPAAAAWGANAFQGVINIITRHPMDVDGSSVAVRNGNNGVQDWRVSSATRHDDRASRVTAFSLSDDGYDGLPGESRRDAKSVQGLNWRGYLELGPETSMELLAGGSRRMLEVSSDFDDFVDYQQFPESHSDEAFGQLRLQHQVSPYHQFKVQAYSQRKRTSEAFSGCFKLGIVNEPPEMGALFFTAEMRQLFEDLERNGRGSVLNPALAAELGDPTSPLFQRLMTLMGANAGPFCALVDFDIVETRHDLEVENTFQFDDYTRLVLGLNARRDVGESETYVNGRVQNDSLRAFGNLEIHIADPLYFNVGGYWERDQLNGTFFSPRVGLIYQFLPSQSVRLVYAESLRTMDIYESRADITIRPQNMLPGYANNSEALLGLEDPVLFATQQSDGNLVPERIRSRELGYFARVGTLEWDIRLFHEELYDLLSTPMSPLSFRPDNLGSVTIRGSEAQLSWRPVPRHLLRATGSHINTRADHPDGQGVWTVETTLAAKELSGLLWRFDVTDRWMLAANWHKARIWRRHSYERADLNISHRLRLRGTTLEVSGQVQRLLTDNPVVREDNLYADRTLYWLTASLNF
jgi:iron complex outermembrane recepter protein